MATRYRTVYSLDVFKALQPQGAVQYKNHDGTMEPAGDAWLEPGNNWELLSALYRGAFCVLVEED